MDMINNTWMSWLQQIGVQPENMGTVARITMVVAILLLAWLVDFFCRKVVIRAIRKVTAKTQNKWDDYLLNDRVLNNLCHLAPPIVIYALIPFAFQGEPVTLAIIMKLCWVYITIVAVRLICSFLTSLYTITNEYEKLKERSMKGFYQMLKLIVICIGTIIVISTLIDKDPLNILAGLGASAAILTLVFKDTIMGLVAGVQLTANDMLRPGDWITMPKFGADGSVLEVTLTAVKIQNWDKTITTVPPYALVNDSFQNWRGMWESGGRRVKRSLNIDMHTVRFCTTEEIEAYRKEEWMQGFEGTGDKEVNLYVFRHYVEHYLRHHPKVHQELMIMVRQLQPTADGLPIELYFFSDGTTWVPYERLQAEVFDHLLAVLPMFGLKVFQRPTGLDLQMSGTVGIA
ncbi:MAG: mechanosensitive ion channel family protein [Bacteroides sp.]|nr:mechanosensitive ion channel family protein [Bacteroides sp.]